MKTDKSRFRLRMFDSPLNVCLGLSKRSLIFFLSPSKGNDERKEMEGKQEYNLQSRFHSGVMTLVGDDVMGKDLEPISGAGGQQAALYINRNS